MAQEQFGPYQLEELIGRGGMGEVFRAFDTVRKRTVALKRLPLRLGADPTFQARFRRESELAARLSEPHIIPIHDYGEIDGQLYIDMPLVSGIDLGDLLERDGALPPARAVDIVSQVAMALDAAHARGLVHRDVKPSNILIAQGSRGDQDFVYLVDFGVARSVGMVDTSLTATGSAVGTLDYMAPERFTGRADDARVDVYALACVLYEALTGRKPFAGDGLPVMMHAHLTVDPPAPSRLRSAIPAALDEVVARGMAKEPDDRYPSTARLAAAARAALEPAVANGRARGRTDDDRRRVPAPAAPHPSERGTAGHAARGRGAAELRHRAARPSGPARTWPTRGASAGSRVRRAWSSDRRCSRSGALLLVDFPDPDDDPDVFLDAVVADPTPFQASALVSLLGLLFLVHGLAGVAHMLRGRHVGMGQIGAGLLIASAILGNSYVFEVVVAVAAGEEFDRDQVLAVVSAAGVEPVAGARAAGGAGQRPRPHPPRGRAGAPRCDADVDPDPAGHLGRRARRARRERYRPEPAGAVGARHGAVRDPGDRHRDPHPAVLRRGLGEVDATRRRAGGATSRGRGRAGPNRDGPRDGRRRTVRGVAGLRHGTAGR